MGEIRTGIIGGVSGKVGPVVGAIVRNVPTIRAKPKKSSKKPSANMIAHRTKFGIAGKFIRSLNRVVNLGYQSFSDRMTPANAALQDLINSAITGVYPDYEIHFPSVTLSKGELPDSYTMKMQAKVAESVLVFTWNPLNELGLGGIDNYADDELVFVVYDEEAKRFMISLRAAKRLSGTKELELPVIFSGHQLHVWIFFVSKDGSAVSNSQYLGSVVTTV